MGVTSFPLLTPPPPPPYPPTMSNFVIFNSEPLPLNKRENLNYYMH